MVVWLADGTKAIIQDVWVEYLAEAVAVFNFKVEDFHTYFVGYRGVLVHNANCGNIDDGLGTYDDQKGHHVMAKKGFEGADGYDAGTAITISQAKLDEFDVKHSTITGQQNSLYSQFAKTGEILTMDVMENIEQQALINSGIPAEYANNAVEKAVTDLLANGVTQPTKISWNNKG